MEEATISKVEVFANETAKVVRICIDYGYSTKHLYYKPVDQEPPLEDISNWLIRLIERGQQKLRELRHQTLLTPISEDKAMELSQ